MRLTIALAAAILASTQTGMAQDATGDVAEGETAFRQCVTCHVVTDPNGNRLAGRNGRTGPNLYGIAGRPAGSIEGFRYSPALTAMAEAGIEWDEAGFVAFVQDPTGHVRATTGDNSLRSAMSYRVRSAEDALNIYAYLASLAAE